MTMDTKSQIAKATLSLLTIVVTLFLLGILVIVVCAGLQINPFRETTTSFLISAFMGLIGIATVLVLLNVATNIGMIADSKLVELKIEPRPGRLKKWYAGFAATAVLVVGIIFGGTYLSKERYLGVVRSQADEVLQDNKNLLDEISHLLASNKPEDYKRIHEIKSFLANQRSDLPALSVIYAGKFNDKPAFFTVPNYFPSNDSKLTYNPDYFRCTQNLDCAYLKTFFSGGNTNVLQKYTIRDDEFYIYIPVSGKEARYVLLFYRRNSYGKLGS